MNICLTAPEKPGAKIITDQPIKKRLLDAATDLFAEKGYAGTSVRDICTRAEASVPMISHHFGNKEGLFRAIVEQFSTDVMDAPLRMIATPAKTRDEFLTRLEMFISEAFHVLISKAQVFRIMTREGTAFADFSHLHTSLAEYLRAAQNSGFLRVELDAEMVTGLVLDRLGNQIQAAINPGYTGPNALTDEAFREKWLRANIEVLLFGLAGK